MYDGATTAGTHTPRSSQSCAGVVRSTPPGSALRQSVNTMPSTIDVERSTRDGSSSATLESPALPRTSLRLGISEIPILPSNPLTAADPLSTQLNFCEFLRPDSTRSSSFGSLHSRFAFAGVAPLKTRDGSTSALHQLNAGLATWRAEIAALDALKVASGPSTARSTSTLTGTPRWSPASGEPDLLRAWPEPWTAHVAGNSLTPASAGQGAAGSFGSAIPRSARLRSERLPSSWPSVSGLSWLTQLPPQAQGRLAACASPAEAIDVLDDVLDSLPSGEQSGGRSRRWRSSSTSGRQPATCAWGEAAPKCAPPAPPSAEAVAASAALLRKYNDDKHRLEEQLQEQALRFEQELAETQRRFRRERRKKCQQLLAQVDPPKGSVHSSSRLPEASRRRQAAEDSNWRRDRACIASPVSAGTLRLLPGGKVGEQSSAKCEVAAPRGDHCVWGVLESAV